MGNTYEVKTVKEEEKDEDTSQENMQHRVSNCKQAPVVIEMRVILTLQYLENT